MIVDAAAFVVARERVLRAVSTEPSPKNPALRCVLLEVGDGGLRMVATDAVRLVVAEVVGSDGAGAVAATAVVPASALAEVDVSPDHRRLTVDVRRGAVAFDVGGEVTTLDAADVEFPNYVPFLARGEDVEEIVVDRLALLAAIEDQPDDEPLRVTLRPTRLELGDLVPVVVDARYSGEVVRVMMDPLLLHDAVESAAGPDVALQVESPVSPVAIRSPDDTSFIAIVMPLRAGGPGKLRRR